MFDSLEEKVSNPEKVVRGLRHGLAVVNQREESLNESVDSLRVQAEKSGTSNSILTSVIGIDIVQTTKSYNYNKKRTTSHSFFMSTSRSTNVKLCMQRAA